MTIGLAGIPVTAYVARFTVPIASWGWRLVFVWGSLGLLVLLFANYLEESPRWYDNRGKLAEADAALERIEACGRAEFGDLPPAPETVVEAPGLSILSPFPHPQDHDKAPASPMKIEAGFEL